MNEVILDRANVLKEINKIFKLRLFNGIKKMILSKNRNNILNIYDYKMATEDEKKALLKKGYDDTNKETSSFYLSLHSIYTLKEIVKREREIQSFTTEDITVLKVNYMYDGIEFTANYPTRFTVDLKREMEDVILELQDNRYSHIVDSFKIVKDFERSPSKPLDNASLKYNCIYLLSLEPKDITRLSQKLYEANLITDINTKGWNIDNEVVEEIITILNMKYKESEVLNFKRTFKDKNVDRSDECIRPINFSTQYFPKKIHTTKEFRNIKFDSVDDMQNAIKIYEFIFYITISTQMKDSVYDNSSLKIVCGDKTLTQKANVLIDGQKNWELISGNIIRKIKENDSTDMSELSMYNIVVLPELQTEQELTPLSVYKHTYSAKRPRRFSIARFLTQILSKENLSNKEYDLIVKEIIDSKACLNISNMLNPQNSLMFLFDWIDEYMPIILDKDYIDEVDEKIDLVTRNELSLDGLLNEFNVLIDNAFMKAGYSDEDTPPSETKIKFLKKLALKHNFKIDNDVLTSNSKCDYLISQYPVDEVIKLGKCPSCNTDVTQKEFLNNKTQQISYYFSCENAVNKTCNFTMWDDNIKTFFSSKGLELYSVTDRVNVLSKILSRKKGYMFTNLKSKAKKSYDARILLECKNNKWNFALAFANNKDKVDKLKHKFDINESNNNKDMFNNISPNKEEIKTKIQDEIKIDGVGSNKDFNRDIDVFINKGLFGKLSLAIFKIDNLEEVKNSYNDNTHLVLTNNILNTIKDITKDKRVKIYIIDNELFYILLIEENRDIVILLETILGTIFTTSYTINNNIITSSLSIGSCLKDSSISDISLLVKNANDMLIESKNLGSNNLKIFNN